MTPKFSFTVIFFYLREFGIARFLYIEKWKVSEECEGVGDFEEFFKALVSRLISSIISMFVESIVHNVHEWTKLARLIEP